MGINFGNKEVKEIYVYVDVIYGIYRNSNLGLITIGDGDNSITISDKNVGATSTDISSTDSYGNYFQWGNCYNGWSYTSLPTITSSTRVDATSYTASSYNSDTWIKQTYWETGGNNLNLRGYTTGTFEAMRGPCSEGFHIPESSEYANLIEIITNLGLGGSGNVGTVLSYLKMPKAGRINYAGTAVVNTGSGIYLRCCNTSSGHSKYYLGINGVLQVQTVTSGYGNNIRPFKNDVVQPDDSRTKLY